MVTIWVNVSLKYIKTIIIKIITLFMGVIMYVDIIFVTIIKDLDG